jgi:alkanesulfonate monooxygenase SsuD/methylene tetrahydromethanopterin reductase-like flavin-dependent oxidoreductase (luciferase family)
MRVSLFTEIQCPEGASPLARLEEFLEQAVLADRLGFRGYWIAEVHCQPRFSLLSAPYTVLGAVSQRTERLRLGVAVNLVTVHHPVQVAEQAAMLDQLSHGRMDFAAGGGHPHTRVYECFGVEHEKTREIMEESLRIIQAAWKEDVLKFDGQFFHIPEIVVNPKPLQRPHPPIYIAAGSPDGVEFAARLGFNIFLPLHTRTRVQLLDLSNSYWEILEKNGQDPTQRELGLLIPVHLAEDAAEAGNRAEDGIMSYYRTIGDMRRDYIQWLDQMGRALPGRLSKTATGEPLTFERVCAEHAVVGDSDTAVAALERLADETGATHILAWMNIGSVPHRFVRESMEHFARDVMPRIEAHDPRKRKGPSAA